jgi:hypothetical protein
MAAVDFGREFTILFNIAGQGLLEENSLSGADQGRGVLAMVRSRGDDHSGVANAGFRQFLHRIEDGNLGAGLAERTPRALDVRIGDRDQAATAGFALEFNGVKKVDGAHSAKAGDR